MLAPNGMSATDDVEQAYPQSSRSVARMCDFIAANFLAGHRFGRYCPRRRPASEICDERLQENDGHDAEQICQPSQAIAGPGDAEPGSTIRQSGHDGALSRALLNYGLTREELQSGKPIIGIAQTGSDLSPCNRHHLELAKRVREGIREAGGIAIEFPVHPIQETGKRPTAGARPQPRLSRPGRSALRLSARRRRADHRLRQDHAGLLMARHRQHPGDRPVGRPDAERLVQGRAHRFRHHRLEGARDAGRRRDRL
jgi:hypothetical protein